MRPEKCKVYINSLCFYTSSHHFCIGCIQYVLYKNNWSQSKRFSDEIKLGVPEKKHVYALPDSNPIVILLLK